MDGFFWVAGMEDGAAGYEDIGACFAQAAGVFGGHATIDLDEGIKAPVVDHTAEVADLLVGVGDKFLTAEPRVDAHDQDGVEILQDVGEKIDGGARVEGDAGFHAKAFYLLDIPVDMWAGFEVDGEPVGAGFSEGFRIAFRFFDHQVDVAGLCGGFADLLDDRQSETDVWNEPAVHD